jgi:hypothetical protein
VASYAHGALSDVDRVADSLVAGAASARADPAFDRLEAALPPGWSLLATGSEA